MTLVDQLDMPERKQVSPFFHILCTITVPDSSENKMKVNARRPCLRLTSSYFIRNYTLCSAFTKDSVAQTQDA